MYLLVIFPIALLIDLFLFFNAFVSCAAVVLRSPKLELRGSNSIWILVNFLPAKLLSVPPALLLFAAALPITSITLPLFFSFILVVAALKEGSAAAGVAVEDGALK